MPLDKPTVEALIPVDDDIPGTWDSTGYENKGHWVGANGGWIVIAKHPGRWYLQNVYNMVRIEMPPVQRVDICPAEDQWNPCPPCTYIYKHARIELLKILITKKPYRSGKEGEYSVMAVFDKFIAIISVPFDRDWIILRNDYLAPAKYVDALAVGFLYPMERIYAVTEPRGEVLVWEPYKWSESCYLNVKFRIYLQHLC